MTNISRDTVKLEVTENVAFQTSSHTTEQLLDNQNWILGGGAAQGAGTPGDPGSVGLTSAVIQTLLRPGLNFYIEDIREEEQKSPAKNKIKREELSTNTKISELVDLVFKKINEDFSEQGSNIRVLTNSSQPLTIEIHNA